MLIKERWRSEEIVYYDFVTKGFPTGYYFTFSSVCMPCLRDNTGNQHGVILIWGHHVDTGNLYFFDGRKFETAHEFCEELEKYIEKYDFGNIYFNENKKSWRLYSVLFNRYNLLKRCIFRAADYGNEEEGEFLLMNKISRQALKFVAKSMVFNSIGRFTSKRSEGFDQTMSAICTALFGITKFDRVGISQPWQKQIQIRTNVMSTETNQP